MSEIKTNKISAIANADLQLNVQQTQRVLITPTGVEVTGAVKATSNAIIAGNVRIGSTVAPTVALDVTGAVKTSSTAIIAGNVSIGSTSTPTVALDVVGEARTSTSTTSASNSKTLVTKDYLDSVNFGSQTWQNFDIGGNNANRESVTVYTNLTNRAITVSISFSVESSSGVARIDVSSDGGSTYIDVAQGSANSSSPGFILNLMTIVPVGHKYRFILGGNNTLTKWRELR